jgi:hypothetical protein
MSRKPSSFDALMKEVEAETRAAGPEAEAEAEAEAQAQALRDHFRLAAQVLRRRRELGLRAEVAFVPWKGKPAGARRAPRVGIMARCIAAKTR